MKFFIFVLKLLFLCQVTLAFAKNFLSEVRTHMDKHGYYACQDVGSKILSRDDKNALIGILRSHCALTCHVSTFDPNGKTVSFRFCFATDRHGIKKVLHTKSISRLNSYGLSIPVLKREEIEAGLSDPKVVSAFRKVADFSANLSKERSGMINVSIHRTEAPTNDIAWHFDIFPHQRETVDILITMVIEKSKNAGVDGHQEALRIGEVSIDQAESFFASSISSENIRICKKDPRITVVKTLDDLEGAFYCIDQDILCKKRQTYHVHCRKSDIGSQARTSLISRQGHHSLIALFAIDASMPFVYAVRDALKDNPDFTKDYVNGLILDSDPKAKPENLKQYECQFRHSKYAYGSFGFYNALFSQLYADEARFIDKKTGEMLSQRVLQEKIFSSIVLLNRATYLINNCSVPSPFLDTIPF